MEPLWSPVVATGGNRSQIAHARERRKQAEAVATGCHRLPERWSGGGRRFESVRGLRELPANQVLPLAIAATSLGSDVHLASTMRRDRFRSGLETPSTSGLPGFGGGVHPASTARSSASASSSETAGRGCRGRGCRSCAEFALPSKLGATVARGEQERLDDMRHGVADEAEVDAVGTLEADCLERCRDSAFHRVKCAASTMSVPRSHTWSLSANARGVLPSGPAITSNTISCGARTQSP